MTQPPTNPNPSDDDSAADDLLMVLLSAIAITTTCAIVGLTMGLLYGVFFK